ncbi:pyridoxamine 5'-phosphate oxidase family protein [Haloarcula pelagica]|uniref:pyridoxamine 5'-phosphate oxidase family protein n=1 Tax=Haloarcula pelagica TaxID=3033389 RepID=UPI0024C41AF2|nr:pyridoxamine 5'-phosphate oxidase family protein [Halomicroarcula sp. YJ-61-S]
MGDTKSIEMDPATQDEHLGTGGTGVLSFSGPAADAPHSVPVSYGYDPDERVFYFRLAVGPDSEKASLLDRAVTFVVHGESDDGWWSVIARGELESTAAEATALDSLAGLERVDIPLVDVFDTPLRVVDFEFCRLVPTAQTGRRETGGEI